MNDTADRGPESPEMCDSDMAVYLNDSRRRPDYAKVLTGNIELMKRWAAEGK